MSVFEDAEMHWNWFLYCDIITVEIMKFFVIEILKNIFIMIFLHPKLSHFLTSSLVIQEKGIAVLQYGH